jgi:asparagine synthase (glutamine-hydrolysing)
MNNWLAITNKNLNMKQNLESLSNNKVMIKDNLKLYYKLDGRFLKDQIFYENQNYLIVIDGVILNLSELMKKYNTYNIQMTVIEMYKKNGEEFFNELRGPFCGFFYDSFKNKTICFSNHTGDAPIFSYEDDNIWLVGSDFNYIVSFLKENSINYTFNETAAKYILTFGYMIDDSTFIKEIKRITAGKYLINDGNKLTEKTYHMFKNKSIDVSFDEAIELIDNAFRKATKRCFEKDLEYGYEYHLVDMSAGLDSRMTNWIAKDMGYNKIFNISYSQLNSDEHKISGLVSSTLNNQLIHKKLDDVSFIYEIDEIIKYNYGLALFCGITGGKQLLESLNYNKFGLEHTGQLGDVIIGTFSKIIKNEKPNINSYRYSELLSINFEDKIVEKYDNQELYNLYSRGFLGALSTHITRRNYTYIVSPFLDVDFLSLCLSIPLKYRVNHKLYWAWVDKKYPNAGKIPSTRKRQNVDLYEKVKYLYSRAVKKVQRESLRALSKLHIVNHASSPNDMNPFEYWYDTDSNLRNFISEYYDTNITELNDYAEIKKYVEEMYFSKNIMDKMMALSVIGTVKAYFGGDYE